MPEQPTSSREARVGLRSWTTSHTPTVAKEGKDKSIRGHFGTPVQLPASCQSQMTGLHAGRIHQGGYHLKSELMLMDTVATKGPGFNPRDKF